MKAINDEIVYFDFRIIQFPDGKQIIDETIKTPMDSLTPEMQMEYKEVDEQIAFMERMQRKERREEARKQKIARNPLYKMACVFGMV